MLRWSVVVFAPSEEIIIFFIVPPKGVELVVINHVNPRKNNVNLGVKRSERKGLKNIIKIYFIDPQNKSSLSWK